MSSQQKFSFFRQSGWMVMATFFGGIFMAGVQVLAIRMKDVDCNNFVDLLALTVVVGGVPAAALQYVFAQHAAMAVTEEKIGHLSATIRALVKSAFFAWLVVFVLSLVFGAQLAAVLGVNNLAAVHITIGCILPLILGPIFKGVLQGEHRFAPLGGLLMLEGVIRFSAFYILALVLSGGATGGALAVFTGQYLVLILGIWMTRDIWRRKPTAPFSWRQWLVRGIPLTMGLGAYVCMGRLDNLFTKSLFRASFYQENLKLYNCAMFVGFAITQFIAPISAVMFPIIVRNLALSKKSNVLVLTLGVTGGFAFLAAVGCTLFPQLPIRLLFPNKLDAAILVPWFAWALLPLALAFVLIQNLLAQERYYAARWLMMVPVCYFLTLMAQGPMMLDMPIFKAFERVILTLGLFNLLLFGVAAWFTWRKPAGARSP